jgi:hypothetical protein
LPSKRFILHYPDGSRAHISTSERDELLIAAKISKLNDFSYLYTSQPRIFHSLADLEPLRQQIQPIGPFKRFLAGHFIIERNKRRQHELLETVEGMTIRLQTA